MLGWLSCAASRASSRNICHEVLLLGEMRADPLDDHRLLEALEPFLPGEEDLRHPAHRQAVEQDVLAEAEPAAALHGKTLSQRLGRLALRSRRTRTLSGASSPRGAGKSSSEAPGRATSSAVRPARRTPSARAASKRRPGSDATLHAARSQPPGATSAAACAASPGQSRAAENVPERPRANPGGSSTTASNRSPRLPKRLQPLEHVSRQPVRLRRRLPVQPCVLLGPGERAAAEVDVDRADRAPCSRQHPEGAGVGEAVEQRALPGMRADPAPGLAGVEVETHREPLAGSDAKAQALLQHVDRLDRVTSERQRRSARCPLLAAETPRLPRTGLEVHRAESEQGHRRVRHRCRILSVVDAEDGHVAEDVERQARQRRLPFR